MNDYVTKPISVRDLADVLDRWLPAASASEVPAEEQPAAEAAETPPSASPVVWDKASMMARFMNDDELGKFIVRSFLDDLPQLLAQLQSALAAGEGADAERHAHSIKGAASNVGGTAVSRLAQRIEEKARAGQLDNAKQLAAEMDEALHQLRTATRTFLD